MDPKRPQTPTKDRTGETPHPALLALVRLLARQAAREALAKGSATAREQIDEQTPEQP